MVNVMQSDGKSGSLGWLIGGMALVALGSVARPVSAESSCVAAGSAVMSYNETDAMRLHKEGVDAWNAGDLETARARFEMACQRIHDPRILANLGQAEFQLGMYRQSAVHLTSYIEGSAGVQDDQEREKVAKAKAMLAQAKAKVGMVTIRGAAPDAKVLVDGAPLGRAREVIFVEPGVHDFVSTSFSGETVRETTFVAAGSSPEVELAPQKDALKVVTPASWSGAVSSDAKPTGRWVNPTLIGAGISMAIGGALIGVGMHYSARVDEVERHTEPSQDTRGARIPEFEGELRIQDYRTVANTLVLSGVPPLVIGGAFGIAALAVKGIGERSHSSRMSITVAPFGAGIGVVGKF